MAKKTKRNQHKKQQRALKKRSQRKQRLSRRIAQESTPERPGRILYQAREIPIEGIWVQQGWQEQGFARIVLARTQPTEEILFGEYIIDYFCTGLKDTTYVTNVDPRVFGTEVIPRLYGGVPPVAISDELAHEMIWGGIEFAESNGLRPERGFQETQRILEPADVLPRTGAIQFGYEGKPLYIPGPNDNQMAILRRLIDAVGLGHFYYLPQGPVPDNVAELLQMKDGDEAGDPGIWTPGQEQTNAGSFDTDSGLWTPGQETNTATTSAEQPSGASPIWTPERS